jgi:hypothetical protein
MKVEITRTGPADELAYTLRREDGETCQTKDLVEVRRTFKEWSDMEYQPRTASQALANLGAIVEALRPSNNPRPSKEQLKAAFHEIRRINKLARERKLRPDL